MSDKLPQEADPVERFSTSGRENRAALLAEMEPAEALRHNPPTERPAEPARGFAVEAARLMADLRCEDVVVFDVRGRSEVTDFIIIASGTSDRQIKSIGRRVAEVAQEFGLDRLGTERDGDAKWLVLDFVEVMVHLFEPVTRAHYDLEMLWGDAPKVRWRR